MLGRLKLKRDAAPAPLTSEPSETSVRAWDILGSSQIRHPDQVATPEPRLVENAAASRSSSSAPDHAATIHTLFQATIGRDPTPEEIGYYARFFDAQDARGGLQASLRALLDGPEHHRRIRSMVEATTLGAAASAEVAPMRHVVSLGTHCYASWLLRDMGLRRYSSPFDWLFSSPQLVTHCIQDDFATLLDRRHYEQNGQHRQALHRYYHEGFSTEAVPHEPLPLFFHHNPAADEDYARLVRGVDRFRRLLDNQDTKLLFMLVNRHRRQDKLVPAIQNLVATLEARTRNAVLLTVVHSSITDQATSQSARLWQQGPHSLHALHSSSDMVNGLSFAHQFDNLLIKRLIYQYRFDLALQP